MIPRKVVEEWAHLEVQAALAHPIPDRNPALDPVHSRKVSHARKMGRG